jgi:pyruvyltransferase
MSIKLYWCRGSGRNDSSLQNFGDYLSPIIVEILSGKKVSYSPVKKADLIAIGSVLAREKKAKILGIKRTLDIWGAGAGYPDEEFSAHHRYHAVRGEHTRSKIKNDAGCNTVLGDPGLLADSYVDKSNIKKWRVGIIPHYVDQSNINLAEIVGSLKGSKIINVFDTVENVLKEISQCEYVLSSSMHGLIVADSYGVPNRRLKLSDGIISDHKFKDYYSCFSIYEPEPFTVETITENGLDLDFEIGTYNRPNISAVKDTLVSRFPYLKAER